MTPPGAAFTCELVLFVNGASNRSSHAVDHARRLCQVELSGAGSLAVVDIVEDPRAAVRHGVHAAPTLVRTAPGPVRRFTGDLSHTARVLTALELPLAPVAAG